MLGEAVHKRRRVARACERCREIKAKVSWDTIPKISGSTLTYHCSAMGSSRSAVVVLATATRVDGISVETTA